MLILHDLYRVQMILNPCLIIQHVGMTLLCKVKMVVPLYLILAEVVFADGLRISKR